MERQVNDLALRKQALKLRLAAQAEKLVAHIEGLDEPKTPLEAERMAKALKAADAAIEQIFKGEDDTSDEPEEEDMNDDLAGRDWRAELEHKLNRLAAARGEGRLAGQSAGGTEAARGIDAMVVPDQSGADTTAGRLA